MTALLIELKARTIDLDGVRRRLEQLGAQRVGIFHQIDTYFEVNHGRLKIRETDSQDSAEIVYYVRANVPDIKRSDILLFKAQPPDIAKELLAKFFPTKVVIDKMREIYVLGKTRIHLDQVAHLGNFIEFERLTANESSEIEESMTILAELCAKFGIRREDLEAFSYADLLIRKKSMKDRHLSMR